MIDIYERHVQLTPDERAELYALPSGSAPAPEAAQPLVRELLLSHEQRSRGRLRLPQTDGTEVRLFLERGEALQLGEYLRGSKGELLRVAGAVEAVATARCEDWLAFSKACYHLGNRHVKLQIGERWLRIVRDHVLEGMLRGLGLQVVHEEAVFDPEAGAYAQGHGHSHGHSHTHDHEDHDGHSQLHQPSLLLRHAHHKH